MRKRVCGIVYLPAYTGHEFYRGKGNKSMGTGRNNEIVSGISIALISILFTRKQISPFRLEEGIRNLKGDIFQVHTILP